MPRRPKKMHRGGRQRKPKRRATRQQKTARAASQPVAVAPVAAGASTATAQPTPRPTPVATRQAPRRRVPTRPRVSPLDLAAANLDYLPGDLKRIGLVSSVLLAVLIVLTIVLR